MVAEPSDCFNLKGDWVVMARSFECTDQYARKVLDTADIVREAIYRWRRASALIGWFPPFAFAVDAEHEVCGFKSGQECRAGYLLRPPPPRIPPPIDPPKFWVRC